MTRLVAAAEQAQREYRRDAYAPDGEGVEEGREVVYDPAEHYGEGHAARGPEGVLALYERGGGAHAEPHEVYEQGRQRLAADGGELPVYGQHDGYDERGRARDGVVQRDSSR